MKTNKQRMYDSVRWRTSRRRHLAEHPLCVICERQGRTTAATVVDHTIPHKGDPLLFWDRSIWQSLCATCHSGIKRIQENRGYSAAAGIDGLPIDAGHPWAKNQDGGGA